MQKVTVGYEWVMRLIDGLANLHANATSAYQQGYLFEMWKEADAVGFKAFSQAISAELSEKYFYSKEDAEQIVAAEDELIKERWGDCEDPSDVAQELALEDGH